jgi:carbon monoxide dehydrogenase subunit G
MRIEQSFTLPVGRDKAWETLMNIPLVATCMPGVENFEAVDDKTFKGALGVKVGPVSLKFQAQAVLVERDDQAGVAKLDVQGSDAKSGGSVRGTMGMSVQPISENETRVNTVTDVNVLGKIGQFGVPLMKKQADSMLGQFAKCLATKI